jgi:TIR domain-containing protein
MTAEPQYDFFVSYRGQDRELARWVAAVLERHGWSVIIQDRDFSEWSFVADMERAFRHSRALLAVFTRSYLTSGFTKHEYDTARFLSQKEGRYRVAVLGFFPWEDQLETEGVAVIDLLANPEGEACERAIVAGLRQTGL